ncbi:glutamate racemase [Patescibacteria group bacterium]
MNIGIFDSGFGGLDILKHIVKELPEYNFIYLGDTARAPYGARSKEIIYKFTEQAVDFLFKNDCQLVILACNTASSDALRKIQQKYLIKKNSDKRVLGVIIPAVEQAVQDTKNNKIGVMATEASVNSGAFEREIKKLNPKIRVFQQACPLLVPIIENGEKDNQIINLAIKNYLSPLIKKKIDVLILGCTHYGIIKNKILNIAGSNIKIISEGEIIARKLKDYLKRHPEINNVLERKYKRVFFSTDLTDKFSLLGNKFFGQDIKAKVALLK